MALIKCKECGKDVSTDAKTCPGCGANMPRKTSLFTKLVAGLIGIAVLSAIFGGNDSKTRTTTAAPKVKSQAELDDDSRFSLARASYKGLKSSLKDPDSLVVEKLLIDEKGTVACMQYRAKNGFGGYNKDIVVVADSKIQRGTEALIAKYCKSAKFDLTAVAN